MNEDWALVVCIVYLFLFPFILAWIEDSELETHDE
jgi:hypothetical protein